MDFTLAKGAETTITVHILSSMLLNIAVLPKLQESSERHGIATTIRETFGKKGIVSRLGGLGC
jgi:retinol dehydrogenase 12